MIEIGGFQRISLIDYPGKVVSIIFTVGCNFRCPFCHNSDLALRRYERIKLYSYDEIFSKLDDAKSFIDGVEITGGEPTIWGDELIDFIKKLKKYGLIKLDSNGSNPQVLEKILKENLVDYIAMDIKTSLSINCYSKAIGLPNMPQQLFQNIKQSIDLLKNSKIPHEFRTTVVPGLVTKEDVISIANYIKGSKYVIQKFVPRNTLDPEFEKVLPYPEAFFDELCKSIKDLVACEVR